MRSRLLDSISERAMLRDCSVVLVLGVRVTAEYLSSRMMYSGVGRLGSFGGIKRKTPGREWFVSNEQTCGGMGGGGGGQ